MSSGQQVSSHPGWAPAEQDQLWPPMFSWVFLSLQQESGGFFGTVLAAALPGLMEGGWG